jgi:hypothetical protein
MPCLLNLRASGASGGRLPWAPAGPFLCTKAEWLRTGCAGSDFDLRRFVIFTFLFQLPSGVFNHSNGVLVLGHFRLVLH